MRPHLPPVQSSGRATKNLKAMVYPALGCPTPVSIPAVIVSSLSKPAYYPLVEGFMQGPTVAPEIHDHAVLIQHRLPSGARVYSTYRCYFKQHTSFPLNKNVGSGVRGDLVIMRGARKNFFNVVNMRTSDRAIVDKVVTSIAENIREFQQNGTPIPARILTMPETKKKRTI
ncbi:hypothetical protein K438DRAFT_1774958 [Mycena galopus ATCC 62051]|nr:hypothetical protein K438DRAFT_1774958 [Mycena galopus ATCC 62051]